MVQIPATVAAAMTVVGAVAMMAEEMAVMGMTAVAGMIAEAAMMGVETMEEVGVEVGMSAVT